MPVLHYCHRNQYFFAWCSFLRSYQCSEAHRRFNQASSTDWRALGGRIKGHQQSKAYHSVRDWRHEISLRDHVSWRQLSLNFTFYSTAADCWDFWRIRLRIRRKSCLDPGLKVRERRVFIFNDMIIKLCTIINPDGNEALTLSRRSQQS